MKNIPEILETERKKLKITQEFFAYKLKISPSSYQRIRRGETWVTAQDLFRFCEILKISINIFED